MKDSLKVFKNSSVSFETKAMFPKLTIRHSSIQITQAHQYVIAMIIGSDEEELRTNREMSDGG